MDNNQTSSAAADEADTKMTRMPLGESLKTAESTHSQAERDDAPEAMGYKKDSDGFEDLVAVTGNRIFNSLASIEDSAQDIELGIEAYAKDRAPELAATSTARDKVLGVNEILTNILVHLPPKNIFGVQRVSKSFLNAIQKSPEIQEKLFLRQRKTTRDLANSPAAWNPFFDDCTSDMNAWFNNVGFESSLLDTRLSDVPCGKIRLGVRAYNDAYMGIIPGVPVVDNGETLRNLLVPTLRTQMNCYPPQSGVSDEGLTASVRTSPMLWFSLLAIHVYFEDQDSRKVPEWETGRLGDIL